MKVLKFIHLLFAGLWIGGAVGLSLMIVGLSAAENDGQLQGFKLACKFVDDLVVIPGAVGCLVSGFFICLLTNWGFFKHRWVIIKWFLTVFCILFGTFHLGPKVNEQPVIALEDGLTALADPAFLANDLASLKGGIVQISLIVFMFLLSVFKPLKGRGGGLFPKVGPKKTG
jgi:hypothetical protein